MNLCCGNSKTGESSDHKILLIKKPWKDTPPEGGWDKLCCKSRLKMRQFWDYRLSIDSGNVKLPNLLMNSCQRANATYCLGVLGKMRRMHRIAKVDKI